MEKFVRREGLVAPLDRANVDTDAIIPKQFLKSIERTGFGPNLFDEWRYLDHGEPGMDHTKRPLNPDFVLNQTRYRGATVLLAWDIARRTREEDDVVPLLAALLLAINPQFVIWAASGLENSIFGFFLALGTWCVLREFRGPGFPWSSVAFFGLAISRPEGILYAAIGGFWAMVFTLHAGRGGDAPERIPLGRSGPARCGRLLVLSRHGPSHADDRIVERLAHLGHDARRDAGGQAAEEQGLHVGCKPRGKCRVAGRDALGWPRRIVSG